MLRGLFARLTGEPSRGSPLFDLAVRQAQRLDWFQDGAVPDTIEGRFSVLASIVALVIVRLEQLGPAGERASVALTERFVATMDTEVREMGVGDPAVGKQVRRLVGALGTRVERFREAAGDGGDWRGAALRGLYREIHPGEEALDHSERELRLLWARLSAGDLETLADGRLE